MKVLMPARILERHVGGNTTYARHLAEGLRDRGVLVESLPAGRNPLSTLALETWHGRLRRENNSVLHYVADTGPLLRTMAPSVVTVHGVASVHISGVRNVPQERIWRARVKRAIESTNAIVTVSHSSARDISGAFGIALEKIIVIPHGIDSTTFAEPIDISTDVQNKIPENFILYVGNIEPRKNLIELAKAVESDDVRRLDLKLVIAGKPAWNSAESMSKIEDSERIVYLGFVSDSDRVALMQRCRAFVFPSRYEGFGFPVLEALASGASVLTSDRGSLREVAGPSTTLESVDAEGIAAGIVRAVADDQQTPDKQRIRRDWASRFNWDTSVNAHYDLYREVGRQ